MAFRVCIKKVDEDVVSVNVFCISSGNSFASDIEMHNTVYIALLGEIR